MVNFNCQLDWARRCPIAGWLQWGMFYAKWNPRLQLHLVLSLWSMVLDSQCAHEWMIWSWYSDHNFIYLPTAGKPGQSNKKLEEDQAVFRYIWSVCSQPVHMDHAPKWVTLANLTLWAWINNTHLDNTPNVLGPCKTFSAFWLYGHHLWSIHYPCVNSYLEKKHCENNLPALQIGLPPCQKHLACHLLHMPKMTFLSFSPLPWDVACYGVQIQTLSLPDFSKESWPSLDPYNNIYFSKT